jgi:nifR3 family TIM-barrel protein
MASLYHPVSIGSLKLGGNVFLAPMADFSDVSYRSVCAECGMDFGCTELISSEALVRDNKKTVEMMARAPSEKAYAVQIFGSSAQTMAQAARVVLKNTSCECIDINCGCPVPKVTKTGAGSVLTREPEKLYSITKAVVEAVNSFDGKRPDFNGKASHSGQNVPVTVKIRSGWDSNHITYRECAQAAIEAGAKAITLHARTTAQGYSGQADWEQIKDLVSFVDGRITVFGNGDVKTPEDAKRMFEQTGCDGLMIGRAAQGNPFIFKKVKEYLTAGVIPEISMNESLEMGFKEMELLINSIGEKGACMKMRGRFSNYIRGFDGAKELRLKVIQCSTEKEFIEVLRPYRLINSCNL